MGKVKTVAIEGDSQDKNKLKKKDSKKQAKVAGMKGGERIASVSADMPVAIETPEEAAESKKTRGPRVRGKQYKKASSAVDKNKTYGVAEAIKLVKETSYAKFDSTVELHLVIRKTGFSTNITLPHSTGKSKKIEVADEKTIEKLESGKVDFDILLATAEMMPRLVPYARLLGPRGLMPNPKNGTLIKNKTDASKFSADTLTVKTEKSAPLVHTVVGKTSMEDKALAENIDTILEAVGKKQVERAHLTATMSPSVKLAVN